MQDEEEDDYSATHGFERNPVYFYRVYESMTTFEEGRHYSNTTDFRTGSLIKCRNDAVNYYNARMQGFESGKAKFFYPFESPSNFKHGENAAYSLVLSIVEYYNDDEYYEYALTGEDEETCADSREIEAYALSWDEEE
jgi:hypothetical protein